MSHRFINEIKPGEYVKDIFMVKDPILRSTTKGDPYIAMYLCDSTGQLNARMWQASEHIYNSLPKPGFVQVDAKGELYQGKMQLVVNKILSIQPENVNIEDFLAKTTKSIPQMFDQLKNIVQQVQNPTLASLIELFLADTDLMRKFCNAPAAVKMHHNYLGGLLEHTLNMLNVAKAIFPYYPDINQDIVITGIFLHDMGKTEELSYDMAFSYTDAGQLIGHITKSVIMVNKKADLLREKGADVDTSLIDVLCHIILAHHGQYEFGSPKLPALPEAFMVNYIDDLDAKIMQVTDAIDTDPSDTDWTAWQNQLQTRLYRRKFE